MSQRVLVTGGRGFVGQWLARRLLSLGEEVTLVGIMAPGGAMVLRPDELAAVRWIETNVRDDAAVNAAVVAARPDTIFHLAGVSSYPGADEAPAIAYDINVGGAVRLLSAARRARDAGTMDPTVLVVGSGTQYGVHPAESMPLDESAAQYPNSVYSASKA